MIAAPPLPGRLAEARRPPEARGVPRDAVRMMVARKATGEILHRTFRDIPHFLNSNDLVVINTSATLPAAVIAESQYGDQFLVHLSTRLSGDLWVTEPRRVAEGASKQWVGEPPPRRAKIGADGLAEFVEPYLASRRLWVTRISVPDEPIAWLQRNGRPIRYDYVDQEWPLQTYQTDYAVDPGSAEMPSAGRPLTAKVITQLVARGVGFAPLTLHAGVSSLEAKEAPFPERLVVPPKTAARVNETRDKGGRVVAVGTTVVRALEAAAEPDGALHPLEGWTDLVITPERGVQIVDAIVTGWHEPQASHLQMLEAIAGPELLRRSYEEAATGGYLFHEFGDSHLILP